MTHAQSLVLVVDAEDASRTHTARWIQQDGYDIVMVSGLQDVAALVDRDPSAVVVTLRGTDPNRVDEARDVRLVFPDAGFVVAAESPAYGARLVRAGLGTFELITVPFIGAQLLEAVGRAVRWHDARRPRQAAAEEQPIWTFDEEDRIWVQRADWLPSPLAVGRIVSDLRLRS